MSADSEIISFCEYFDHKILINMLDELSFKYDFLEISSLGRSILGRSIPLITLGKGKKSVIYIAGHHGMEWITCAILMQFINDFCSEYKSGSNIFELSTRVLFETRKIFIVPMLNPDGIDYAIHGIDKSNVLRDRLIRMNKNSDDFSHWQANARGVDLNHNYSVGFLEYKEIEKNLGISCGASTKYSGEHPESEPEIRALCRFIRFELPSLAITLHTQGEEIFCSCGENFNLNSLPIAQTISRLSGYKLSIPDGTAKYGGFTEWFIDEFNKPSFTIECGKGINPLPFSDFNKIYSKLKRALFTIPIII